MQKTWKQRDQKYTYNTAHSKTLTRLKNEVHIISIDRNISILMVAYNNNGWST